MSPFTYERSRTPAEAAAAVVRQPGARFIAGGTNLLDLMKLQIETPTHLGLTSMRLAVLDLPEGNAMRAPGEAGRQGIGAMVRGVAAAMANAIYNATGVRVRDYPITLDKLLDKLPGPA